MSTYESRDCPRGLYEHCKRVCTEGSLWRLDDCVPAEITENVLLLSFMYNQQLVVGFAASLNQLQLVLGLAAAGVGVCCSWC